MDDPISALDANVKKKIFKNVFMKKFAKKTRVLVTHAIDFLHLVDQIILIKDGRVVLHGPFNEVKENAYLKELVRIFKSHQKEQTTNEPVATTVQSFIEEDEDEIDQTTLEDVTSDSDISDSERSNSSDLIEEDSNDPKPIRSKVNKQRSLSINLGNMTDNDKKMKGQITTNENEEVVRVTWNIYKRY